MSLRLHMPDHAPIATIGPYTVLAERHEVLFKDDSTVGLHQVIHDGQISRFLRCLFHGDAHALIVDVRDLAKGIGTELCIAQDRDVQGLVFYHLRLRYACAAEFSAMAVAMVRSAALVDRPSRQRPLFDLVERCYAPAPITTAA